MPKFKINPKSKEITFLSEGKTIDKPTEFIKNAHSFYKKKGYDIPVNVFESAFIKEMAANKKIKFEVDPTSKSVSFINESKLPITNKKVLAEKAHKFFAKTNMNIPVNVFEEAIDMATQNDDYSDGTINMAVDNFLKSQGIEHLKSDMEFIEALKTVLQTLNREGITIGTLNNSIKEGITNIPAPSSPNKKVVAKKAPDGSIESVEEVDKNQPVQEDDKTVVVEDISSATTLAGLTHAFKEIVDNIAKFVADDLEDDGTLDKLNKLKSDMAQLLAKKDPNIALSQNARQTSNPSYTPTDDDMFIEGEMITNVIKVLAENSDKKINLKTLVEALSSEQMKKNRYASATRNYQQFRNPDEITKALSDVVSDDAELELMKKAIIQGKSWEEYQQMGKDVEITDYFDNDQNKFKKR